MNRRSLVTGAPAESTHAHSHTIHPAKAPGGDKIDVHAHFLPPVYLKALADAGLKTLDGGFPIPAWSAEAHLEAMDRFGIRTSVLSISTPCVHFLSGDPAQRLARAVNEAGAELILRGKGRFGALATLPLPDAGASVTELAYALDVLRLDGVLMETNANGVYLGSPELEPVYRALDERSGVMVIHPTSPACFEQVALGRPAPMIEFQFDTTRAVTDLIFSGTLARFPNIKVIVPHGGAALSVLAARLAMFAEMPIIAPRPAGAQALMEQLGDLHYDLAASAHPAMFAALREVVPMSQLLFGSDWPFTPDVGVQRNVTGFDALPLSFEDREQIAFRNAMRLFPRLTTLKGPVLGPGN